MNLLRAWAYRDIFPIPVKSRPILMKFQKYDATTATTSVWYWQKYNTYSYMYIIWFTKQLPKGLANTTTAFRHTEKRRWKPVSCMDQQHSKCQCHVLVHTKYKFHLNTKGSNMCKKHNLRINLQKKFTQKLLVHCDCHSKTDWQNFSQNYTIFITDLVNVHFPMQDQSFGTIYPCISVLNQTLRVSRTFLRHTFLDSHLTY